MLTRSILIEIKEWTISIAIAAAIAFVIQMFIIQPHEVVGPSMQPTLSEGQRVLVNKFIYRFHPPQRGDILVFRYHQTEQHFIKRVIAVSGDTIEIHDGSVLVNGKLLSEPYTLEPTGGVYKKTAIPAGHIFVLGDNRNNSDDSRFSVGFLPIESITGRAEGVIWPLPAIKLLSPGLAVQ